ncbi:MAG TPA: hypothetical protein VE783_02745 [Candidatus Limnocylindrales bacterium]|jgi:hypothetical protein|nr:hypothetical protein [Candidatus Limnocylindrales bacterium]
MATMDAPPQVLPRSGQASRRARWLKIAGVVVLGILAALIFVLALKWPFSREAMLKRLEHATSGRVEFGKFSSKYFPPGCVAEDVRLYQQRNQTKLPDGEKSEPLIRVERLTISTGYAALLRKHIEKIVAEGAVVHIPHGGAELKSSSGKKNDVTIGDLEADNSVLELAPEKRGEKPMVFKVRRARFRNVGNGDTSAYDVALSVPLPRAEVESKGWIGPWRDANGDVRSTPISGEYAVRNLDLGSFDSMMGMVSSHGEFQGTLAKLNVSGESESPDFGVKESGHHFPLSTKFRGTVDLASGDVELPVLTAKLGSLTLEADAQITGKPKTVQLNVKRGRGEVQDLMLLFSDKPKSPIAGPITFQMRSSLPPEKRPFKQRVQLVGNFDVDPARFTEDDTEDNVAKLSAHARGDKKEMDKDEPPPVLSNLRSDVRLANGEAHFTNLSFSVPGATANMEGTYELTDKKVNLQGKMKMQAKLSEATKGVKSFFLKLLNPFFKKKNAGAELPVAMTGKYGHTHFSVGLTKK